MSVRPCSPPSPDQLGLGDQTSECPVIIGHQGAHQAAMDAADQGEPDQLGGTVPKVTLKVTGPRSR